MDNDDGQGSSSDLAGLVVPQVGRLVATQDPWEPFQLLDPAGTVVGAVAAFLRELQAAGRSPATLRSYGMALLRWFRFLLCTLQPGNQPRRGGCRLVEATRGGTGRPCG